jgi:hypothetical protein
MVITASGSSELRRSRSSSLPKISYAPRNDAKSSARVIRIACDNLSQIQISKGQLRHQRPIFTYARLERGRATLLLGAVLVERKPLTLG